MSQGMAIEASILARLLGIRLLKLDAQIVVLPVEPPEAAPVVVPATVMSGSVEDAERELDRAYRTLSGSGRRSRNIPSPRRAQPDKPVALALRHGACHGVASTVGASMRLSAGGVM